jgi:mercuric ion transport protein
MNGAGKGSWLRAASLESSPRRRQDQCHRPDGRHYQCGLSVGTQELNRMQDRALITTGVVGTVIAAICCATPLLAVVFGAVGLTAWLAGADYVLIPALLICLGLIGLGLHRRRARQG